MRLAENKRVKFEALVELPTCEAKWDYCNERSSETSALKLVGRMYPAKRRVMRLKLQKA